MPHKNTSDQDPKVFRSIDSSRTEENRVRIQLILSDILLLPCEIRWYAPFDTSLDSEVSYGLVVDYRHRNGSVHWFVVHDNGRRYHDTTIRYIPRKILQKVVVSLHPCFQDAAEDTIIDVGLVVETQDKNARARLSRYRTRWGRRKRLLAPISKILAGGYFELEEIEKRISKDYFGNRIACDIGWVHLRHPRPPRTLGRCWPRRPDYGKVGITQVLDDARVPEYVIGKIVFHEMLHIFYPPDPDRIGRLHDKVFRAAEAQYEQYGEAQDWIRTQYRTFAWKRIEEAIARATQRVEI